MSEGVFALLLAARVGGKRGHSIFPEAPDGCLCCFPTAVDRKKRAVPATIWF